MTEEATLERLVNRFMALLRESILPFIHNLNDLYLSRVTFNKIEVDRLEELHDVLSRFITIQQRINRHLKNKEISMHLKEELVELQAVCKDIDELDVDGLEQDLQKLLEDLEFLENELVGLN